MLNINERNYKKALKKYDMLCLLYHEPLPSDRELQQQFHMKEMVLEVRSDGAMEKVTGVMNMREHFMFGYLSVLEKFPISRHDIM